MRKRGITITLDPEIVAWLNTFDNVSSEANRIMRLYYDNIVTKEIVTVEQALVMKGNAKQTIKRLDAIIEMIRADKNGGKSKMEN